MDTGVGSEIEELDRSGCDPARRVDPEQGQHRAVVVCVGVQVEEVSTGGVRQRRQVVPVLALAHVHHALEHPLSLASPPADDTPTTRSTGTVAGVNLGAPELLIVLVVILVLFGGSKLPKLARSLGQAQNEFKQGVKESDADGDDSTPPPVV